MRLLKLSFTFHLVEDYVTMQSEITIQLISATICQRHLGGVNSVFVVCHETLLI